MISLGNYAISQRPSLCHNIPTGQDAQPTSRSQPSSFLLHVRVVRSPLCMHSCLVSFLISTELMCTPLLLCLLLVSIFCISFPRKVLDLSCSFCQKETRVNLVCQTLRYFRLTFFSHNMLPFMGVVDYPTKIPSFINRFLYLGSR
jgi:hypothetical protein